MQGKLSCLLSLFVSKEDAMEVHGAVQWLIKAYEDYRHRVINNSISYKVFVEEFLVRLNMPIFLDEDATYSDLLQEATDRDKVKHILENRKFTENSFTSESFEETDAVKMIGKYNALGTKEQVLENLSEEILPIADYPQEAKDAIAEVFRKHKLLCPDISTDDLIMLLSTGKPSCKYMIPPFAKNVDLGLVIYIILTAGALSRSWPSTICKHGMLLTSSGTKMRVNNLSATVHKFDDYRFNQLNSRQRNIERDIMKALSSVPSAVKNLKNRFATR